LGSINILMYGNTTYTYLIIIKKKEINTAYTYLSKIYKKEKKIKFDLRKPKTNKNLPRDRKFAFYILRKLIGEFFVHCTDFIVKYAPG